MLLFNHSNSNMQDVLQSVSEVKEIIKLGEKESAYTEKSFKEIIQAIEDNLNGASEINDKIQSFVSVIDEIGHATESVSRQAETLNETATGF